MKSNFISPMKTMTAMYRKITAMSKPCKTIRIFFTNIDVLWKYYSIVVIARSKKKGTFANNTMRWQI